MQINLGDLVFAKQVTLKALDGDGEAQISAPRNKEFACIVVGSTEKTEVVTMNAVLMNLLLGGFVRLDLIYQLLGDKVHSQVLNAAIEEIKNANNQNPTIDTNPTV